MTSLAPKHSVPWLSNFAGDRLIVNKFVVKHERVK